MFGLETGALTMLHYIKNVSFAAAGVLVLALAGASSSAQAQDAASNSLTDTVRSNEGIYCGIECSNTAYKRWASERHAPASAARSDWYGLDQSTDDSQPGQY
jgi:hypothetical protein